MSAYNVDACAVGMVLDEEVAQGGALEQGGWVTDGFKWRWDVDERSLWWAYIW